MSYIDPMKKRKPPLAGGDFQPLDRRFDVEQPSVINPNVLETFPYEYKGKDIVIAIDTEEFTAVCPWSGLPDFGTIRVEYVPTSDCIELRSFKYYIMQYRNVGIYQEHVANRVLEDLNSCARPKWMKVTVDYRVRGGVHTVVTRQSANKRRSNPGS
jgi:7-cyano-7-deazaguanine reductase